MAYVFMLFVINCNAQEHLTCLRTDDVLTSTRQPPSQIQQGIPGKRGPRGEAGLTGSKGAKGDPGVPDTSEIDMLRGKTVTRSRADFNKKTDCLDRVHQNMSLDNC